MEVGKLECICAIPVLLAMSSACLGSCAQSGGRSNRYVPPVSEAAGTGCDSRLLSSWKKEVAVICQCFTVMATSWLNGFLFQF